MRTSGDAVYLDASALVKISIAERESGDLAVFLHPRPVRLSCALARVELIRAVRHLGAGAVRRASELLDNMELIRLDEALLDSAAQLGPGSLHSLDAIHLAAALSLGPRLAVVVTYDRRMATAALAIGLPVASPGSSTTQSG